MSICRKHCCLLSVQFKTKAQFVHTNKVNGHTISFDDFPSSCINPLPYNRPDCVWCQIKIVLRLNPTVSILSSKTIRRKMHLIWLRGVSSGSTLFNTQSHTPYGVTIYFYRTLEPILINDHTIGVVRRVNVKQIGSGLDAVLIGVYRVTLHSNRLTETSQVQA